MFNKKLGYYVCDGKEFESKIQAMFHSVETKKPFDWVFNEDIFRQYDWTVEPIETLDMLYDKRSRELRETYDYLILSYSGGADSHNILMSFIRQGLHIDELLINTTERGWNGTVDLDPNNKSNTNSGAEHYLQLIPRLKEVEKFIPKTKITICDMTDSITSSFTKVGDASWIFNKKEALNPIGLHKFNYIYIDEVRKKFDKEKRIGLVFGTEKPRTYVRGNKFFVSFSDRAANMVNIVTHIEDYDNTTVEFFYWSPDAVRMLIKQGHVVKQWLDANPQFLEHWDIDKLTFKTFRLVHERLLRSVVYPTTWNDNWYQSDKATKDWNSEFDLWFIDGMKDEDTRIIWDEGVTYATEKLAQYLRIDPETNRADGFHVINRPYFIGYLSKNTNEST